MKYPENASANPLGGQNSVTELQIGNGFDGLVTCNVATIQADTVLTEKYEI